MSLPDSMFAPDAFEAQFEPLEHVSRRLWLPVLTNSEGDAFARIEVITSWRERLLAGQPPMVVSAQDPDRWPTPEVAAAFSQSVRQLGLHTLTRRHEEITDQVVRNLMWHIDRIALAMAHVSREEAVQLALQAFESDWDHQSFELKEILRVFESLDGVKNFARFSELSGLLQHDAWQAVLAAHEVIATLPELARLIRRLGRARPTDQTVEQASQTHRERVTREQWTRRWVELDLPGAGYDTQGVRRSADLARMLASEAMQLRRRAESVGEKRALRLKRLFAARLAEQGLLTYQQRERHGEMGWVLDDASAMDEVPKPRPELMTGPLIICIDTSASMAGGPEAVGKAVVLEAMKTAHREKRGCRVYAFSGPGDLQSFELPLTVDGIIDIANFLSASFHGGTDIVDPIERALDDVESSQWQGADIIIASDGEFGATRETRARISQVKQAQAMRVQGILIGDRETMGLREVCDDIYWVSDWRRYGFRHGQNETVVHDRNLTSIYFPDAQL